MTSSRRSGQRALFERRHERDGRYAAARWRSACRLLADSVAKLLNAVRHRLFSVDLRRIRSEDTARDFVDRGGRSRSHCGRGRAGRGGDQFKTLASGAAGNCADRGRD